MTAIDNSNRLIIRPSAEKGGRREAGKAREIDRVTARAGPPDIFVAFLLSFFFSSPLPPPPSTDRARARADVHRVYFGLHEVPSCSRETESEINFEGIIIYSSFSRERDRSTQSTTTMTMNRVAIDDPDHD